MATPTGRKASPDGSRIWVPWVVKPLPVRGGAGAEVGADAGAGAGAAAGAGLGVAGNIKPAMPVIASMAPMLDALIRDQWLILGILGNLASVMVVFGLLESALHYGLLRSIAKGTLYGPETR